jgi:sulfate adenylyltransferase subunit 2
VTDKKTLTHLEAARSREHPHHARSGGRGRKAGDALYSVGKDSAVMLHLARKAFYPAPALSAAACRHDLEVSGHVRLARQDGAGSGMELLVYQNPEAKERASTRSIMARCTPICGKPKG